MNLRNTNWNELEVIMSIDLSSLINSTCLLFFTYVETKLIVLLCLKYANENERN